jgi:hypothetical protein
MDYTPTRNGQPAEFFIVPGPDTPARLHLRAHELASFAGPPAAHVTQAHFEQAKHEVSNETREGRYHAHPASVMEAIHS